MKRLHKTFCGFFFCLTLLSSFGTDVLAECSVLVKFFSKEDKTLHTFFPNRELDYQLKENFLLGHIPEEKLNKKGTALKEDWKFCPEGAQKIQHKLARNLEAQEDNGQKYLLRKDTLFTMPANKIQADNTADKATKEEAFKRFEDAEQKRKVANAAKAVADEKVANLKTDLEKLKKDALNRVN